MSKIRFRYAGLVTFSANVLSVLTGLIFTTLVTRRLTVEEFGTWQFYSSILAYFALPSYIINYWLTREVGRGKSVVNSALVFNMVTSWVATVLFLSSSIVLTKSVYAPYEALGAFAIWLMSSYLASTTDATASGSAPHFLGYGTAVFELSKVLSGAILVVWMRLGLAGAVISIDLALLLKLLTLYQFLPSALKGGLSFGVVFDWLKRFWIPVTVMLPTLIYSLDTVLVTMITGSTTPAAYVRASTTFSGVVGFSSSLAIALYPKLLSGGGKKEIEDSIKLVMMFAVPMIFGAVVLAEPLLYILRKEYSPAVWVLRTYAVLSFLATFRNIFTTILVGTENVDVDRGVTYRELSSSALLRVPITEVINSLTYVVVVSLVSLWLDSVNASYESFSLALGIVYILIMIPFLLYYRKWSKTKVQYSIPVANILKYIISGLAMVAFLFLFFPTGAISERISEVMIFLLPTIAAGALLYFSVLLLIDKETRQLAYLVMQRFLKKGS